MTRRSQPGWALFVAAAVGVGTARADVPPLPTQCERVGALCWVGSGYGILGTSVDGTRVATEEGKLYCKVGPSCFASGFRHDLEVEKPPCSALTLAGATPQPAPAPTVSAVPGEGRGACSATARGGASGSNHWLFGGGILLAMGRRARRRHI
ncbi:MAG: hypothetical protein AAGA56_29870 [Myxococcota bacterium]